MRVAVDCPDNELVSLADQVESGCGLKCELDLDRSVVARGRGLGRLALPVHMHRSGMLRSAGQP